MRSRVVAAALVLLAAAGCSHHRAPVESPRGIAQLTGVVVTGRPAGLAPRSEKLGAAIGKVESTYAEAVSLVTLRAADGRVVATLQVTRLKAAERFRTNAFRSSVASALGGTAPIATRMGSRTVWRSSMRKQPVALWFDGTMMSLLTIKADFPHPLQLLRELVESR